jgi:ABC-type multidrug transport system ATPase subunit
VILLVVVVLTAAKQTTVTTAKMIEDKYQHHYHHSTHDIDHDTIMMVQQIRSIHSQTFHPPFHHQQETPSTNHNNDTFHNSYKNNMNSDVGDGGLIWNHLTITTTKHHHHHHPPQQHPPQQHPFSSFTTTRDSNNNHNNSNLHPPHDDSTTILLHDTSGMIPNGHVVGIIGPSGSGKTIFLQTILRSSFSSFSTSSSSSSSSSSPTNGNIYQYQYHNPKKSNHHHHDATTTTASTNTEKISFHPIPSQQIAYISQNDHDTFFDQLTVYETLYFAAFLETLSSTTTTSAIREEDDHGGVHRGSSDHPVDHPNYPKNPTNHHMIHTMVLPTIQQLGLQHVTHRKVGSTSSSVSSSTTTASTRTRTPTGSHRSRFRPWTTTTSTTTKNHYHNNGSGRLSGGERRRLSVGLELVSREKKLLLADEPTSGLDSTYSRIVMTLLRTLAQTRNIPAIISLHQPSSYIWNHILDDIILLAPGGYVCYNGRKDNMISYFANIGYPVPEYTNPSEFFLELVSINTENITQSILDQERIRHLYNTFQQYQQEQLTSNGGTPEQIINGIQQKNIHASFLSSSSPNIIHNNDNATVENNNHRPLLQRLFTTLVQLPFVRSIRRIMALFRRSWRQNIRDTTMNHSRLWISIGNALLLAGVFPSIQKGSRPLISSIADRVALLSFATINLCMMTYLKTITLFAHERPIVQRELNVRQQYTVLEYLIAKVTSELPIDMTFSLLFAVILKYCTGLQISLRQLSQVFASLTTAGASLGFLLGSTAISHQYATTSGIPVLVILMVVGIINPSGVDVTKPKPILLRCLKNISPFAYAIEALCIAEYRGVQFYANSDSSSKSTGGKLGSLVARLKDAPRMGGLAMISVRWSTS